MSHVDVVRAAFLAWERNPAWGDELSTEGRRTTLDEVLERTLHPEVEYREDEEWPGASRYLGLERVKECFQAYDDVLHLDFIRLEDVIDAGDSVVAIVRVGTRPEGATAAVEHRWAYLCRVRDGKLGFFQAFLDPPAALTAVNVELMRRVFEAWNRRDIEAVLELLDPDIEWHPNLQLPDVDPIYRGRERVRRFFRDFLDPWDTITVEPLETRAQGDEVVIRVHFQAHGRDGIDVDVLRSHRYTIRGGLIVAFRSYEDQAEALAAAGIE